ncbi:uncharacterized protein LOC110981036 isoform X2 [Acanthaster planci]|uniref:Uncharacterized protein LOC110981036 isoform X2 n=1 Tax=Acanthaster planci TaxID=133434 RepID=A0A8B7YR45_ACAPL|nr:uncharacterized protein LOC110981036 isoform X2 [Acanthaster planci]
MSDGNMHANGAEIPSTPAASSTLQQSRKRPSSPSPRQEDGRAYKSQRSVSDEIGPGMRQFCRLKSNPKLEESNQGEHLTFTEEGEDFAGNWKETNDTLDEEAIDVGAGGEDGGEGNGAPTSPGQKLAEIQWGLGSCECPFTFEHQQPLEGGQDVVDGLFTELFDAGKKQFSKIIGKLMDHFRLILPKSSLEEHPHNNIHVPHPDKSIGGMIGLGMNIQKAEKGHVVHTVIPDGLAAQSKLREKDVIVSVNGNDVKSWEFERLQQFFGSLAEVEIKIVVEREEEDESGAAFCQKLTLTFQLSLEGDQVIVDVAIKVGISGWKFTGVTGPYYIFQNNVNENTKFLTLKDNCFCMANVNDLTPCRFELVHYDPVINGPRAIVNLNNNSPLDHGEPTRIGENSSDLYGDHVNILTDDRVFFTMRQADSGKFTYELASRKSYFLTVDASGKLTTTYFPSREAVDWSGRFDMVATSRIDKMSPSEIEKFDGDDKTQNLFDREKPVNKWK